jgi:two-component system, LytTR family, response regulator
MDHFTNGRFVSPMVYLLKTPQNHVKSPYLSGTFLIMHKHKILIVDDELDACIELHKAINVISKECDIIESYAHNTADAELLIRLHQPTVVFMDINLRGERGIDFIERIGSFNFQLVFVTAHIEFAIRAIKLNAIDYILKPIQKDELAICFGRLLKLSAPNAPKVAAQKYVANIAATDTIIIKNINVVYTIRFQDIVWIEGIGSYSIFYVVNEKGLTKITGSHSLAYYNDVLPENIFYRCHKSAVINIKMVERINSEDGFTVVLKYGQVAKLSRRKLLEVSTKINF